MIPVHNSHPAKKSTLSTKSIFDETLMQINEARDQYTDSWSPSSVFFSEYIATNDLGWKSPSLDCGVQPDDELVEGDAFGLEEAGVLIEQDNVLEDVGPGESDTSKLLECKLSGSSLDVQHFPNMIEPHQTNLLRGQISTDFHFDIFDATTLEPQLTNTLSLTLPFTNSENTPKPHPENHAMITEHQDTTNSEIPSAKRKIMTEAKQEFQKFASSLRKVNGNNFCRFLADIMRSYHHHIPLESLFNLLYHDEILDQEHILQANLFEGEISAPAEARLRSLEICRLILENFHAPRPAPDLAPGSVTDSLESHVNYHELLRSFLTIKIIFSSVKQIEKSSRSVSMIPRLSLYKVYYIICQMLRQKYKTSSNLAGQTLVVCQSKFGRLTNLVFPESIIKRIGKRGSSKYHYIGFAWDRTSVGDDILELTNLDMPELKKYFRMLPTASIEKYNPSETKIIRAPHYANIQHSVAEPSIINTPLHSFVDISFTYPKSDCSPRVWDTTPNTVPKMSSWAQENMERSAKVLKGYSIELDHLIYYFQTGNFSQENNETLSKTVLQAIILLQCQSAPKHAYLSLYLVSLLMIFPVALSSDSEVDWSKKAQFRTSLKTCLGKLETETTKFTNFDHASLKMFIGVSRKMLYLNEMTSCKVKAPHTEEIINQMSAHLRTATAIKKESFNDVSPLESIYIRSITMSMNAYGFIHTDGEGLPVNDMHVANSISNIAKEFKNTLLKSRKDISLMSKYARRQGSKKVNQDIPYQLLKIGLKNFHEITLAKPLVLKLPMAMITFMTQYHFNWIQSASLHDFSVRSTEFAKEFFKCSWIFSSMYQEYVRILSEVVALSGMLSGNF
ncbi:hypothetical protein JCM33374_g1272 [Metschnikowia sp. JCM 33374]|nr:hypothetical protein JCM33374_g1272 [Metschnikowia sp. JCM 33374]